MNHAKLSPSSAHRWLHCPPSVKLSEQFEEQESIYASEGTCAHQLAEYQVRRYLCEEVVNPIEHLTYFNEEMSEHAKDYVTYIKDIVSVYAEPFISVEERLDLSSVVPESFGTADCIVIANNDLHIVDYKYGQGVLVEAADNPQLQLYAIGALAKYAPLFEIKDIYMHIYQPRKSNACMAYMTAKDLQAWAKEVAKVARLAYEGAGEYQAGAWCRFCPARCACRERAEKMTEIVKKEFPVIGLLTDDEIAMYLDKIDEINAWTKDLFEYALKNALAGKKYKGFKLVEGRSVRRFRDEEAVASILELEGEEPYQQKLKGMTEITKMLGRKRFDELLGAYVTKPPGKITLAPVSDKREEVQSAVEEFKK